MSGVILNSEIQSLISEAKRKKPEIKKTAEASLASLHEHRDLNANDLGRKLRQNASFAAPFILACSTGEPKLVRPGINSLLQLLSLRAVEPSKLTDIFDSLELNISSSQEIQLRILQCFQKADENYTRDLRGGLITRCLNICSDLQTKNNDTVSQISKATFQQIIVSLFDTIKTLQDSSLKPSDGISQGSLLTDGFNLFQDLCLILNGTQSSNRLSVRASPIQALEVVDVILDNDGALIRNNEDYASIMEGILMPFILRELDEQSNFQKIRQTLRIARLILRNHLEQFPDQSKAIFSEITRQIVLQSCTYWKRAMCLEVFVQLLSTDAYVNRLFLLQGPSKIPSTSILGHHLTSLANLVKSSPEALGWNLPSQNQLMDQTEIRFDPSTALPKSQSFQPYNMAESSLRSKLIDQTDHKHNTEIPRFYVHNLILQYMLQLCLDLENAVIQPSFLPASDSAGSKKKKKPKDGSMKSFQDPLNDQGKPISGKIQVYHSMLEEYAAVLLEILSVFVWSVIDEDLYIEYAMAIRRLVMALQLFRSESALQDAIRILRDGCLPYRAASWAREKLSMDDARAYISELGHHRLVCTKTILEIAISVGFLIRKPTWILLWEILASTPEFAYSGLRSDSDYEKDLVLLLNAGVERFFLTTLSMPLPVLDEILQALSSLIQTYLAEEAPEDTPGVSRAIDWMFNIIRKNADKLVKDEQSGQHLSSPFLLGHDIIKQTQHEALCLGTASVLNSTTLALFKAAQHSDKVEGFIFGLFFSTITAETSGEPQEHLQNKSLRLHQLGLDTLSSFIQNFGERIVDWQPVFHCIASVFVSHDYRSSGDIAQSFPEGMINTTETKAEKLVQMGFAILRMACADFRSQIIDSALSKCANVLRAFVSQKTDLNIALEALSTFWAFGSDLTSKTEIHLPHLVLREGDFQNPIDVKTPDSSSSQNVALYTSPPFTGPVISLQYNGSDAISAKKSISLWTSALDALICLTIDSRPNIRSTSAQILMKILNMRKDYTDPLSFDTMYRLLILNLAPLKLLSVEDKPPSANQKEQTLSMIGVLEQASSILRKPRSGSSYIKAYQQGTMLLLRLIKQYAETGWLEPISASMHTLERIVSQCVASDPEDHNLARFALKIWGGACVSSGIGPSSDVLKSHEVQLSWAKTFSAISLKTTLTPSDLLLSLHYLKDGLWLDILPESFRDATALSPYQLEIFQILKSTGSLDPSMILTVLAFSIRLSRFSLQILDERGPAKRSTYFAFSKAALGHLKDLIIEHASNSVMYIDGLFYYSSLETFALYIQTKSERRSGGGRNAPLWQKATQHANEVLRCALEASRRSDVPLATKFDMLAGVILVLYAVASPGKSPNDTNIASDDESDDIALLQRHHRALVQSLSTESRFNSLANLYSLLLYEQSKIHNLFPAANDAEELPLKAFRLQTRSGRTYDVMPAERLNIPSTCFELLVDLASTSSSDSDNQALFSYARQLVIIKAYEALTSYIADQPLRGRQPLPKSHRQEMILILDALVQLHQRLLKDRTAFQSWGKDSSIILPLVAQAMPVAHRDASLLKHLSRASVILSGHSAQEDKDIVRHDVKELPSPSLAKMTSSGKDPDPKLVKDLKLVCAEAGVRDVKESLKRFMQDMRQLQTERAEEASIRAQRSRLEEFIQQ